MSEITKVIYIVGAGHSGSTLLDMIIGSSPQAVSTGELSYINVFANPDKYQNYHCICSCEKLLRDCVTWKEVADLDCSVQHTFSLSENIRMALQIVFRFLKTGKRVTDDSAEFYRAFLDNCKKNNPDADIIIDSSKDPRRLFILMNQSGLEVYPIFLVRDGRSIAHSGYHKKRSDKELLNE